MIPHFPKGMMRPELVGVVLGNLGRTKELKFLYLRLQKEKQQPLPDRKTIRIILLEMLGLMPECISRAHFSQHSQTLLVSWEDRIKLMPDCFSTTQRRHA